MKWTIVSKGDLDSLRCDIEDLKQQRLTADLAANIRFQGMQTLFKLERELLQEYSKAQREDVEAKGWRANVETLRQFDALKLSLLQELQSLRTQVKEEIRQLRLQAQYAVRETTQRAKIEQDALKTRLLGSLRAIEPAVSLTSVCAHEWPVDWTLSPESKYESQQCFLCDLWRFRFSEFWTQHHEQDKISLWYGTAQIPSA